MKSRLAHTSDEATETDQTAADARSLEPILAAAAKMLPAQGPITTFVHHNTLHAFEHLSFETAVVEAARLLGARPYLDEGWYRQQLARGRIRPEDVDAVLDESGPPADAPLLAGDRLTVSDLARLLALNDVGPETDEAARWTLSETDTVFRPAIDTAPGFSRDLWHACLEAVSLTRPPQPHFTPPVRHRDLIMACEPGLDTDALVHPLLIRLAAAFLDQGVAAWAMPGREEGFLAAASRVLAESLTPAEPWAHGRAEVCRAVGSREPLAVAAEELRRLGVPADQRPAFVTQTLLALRGWAGMFHLLETRPDFAPVRRCHARLADFLALRLMLDRLAIEWACTRLHRSTRRARCSWKKPSMARMAFFHSGDAPKSRGFWGSPVAASCGGRRVPQSATPPLAAVWCELRDRCTRGRASGTLSRALLLHRVCLLADLSPHDVRSLDGDAVFELERATLSFSGIERRRLLHLAYERRSREQLLTALALYRPAAADAADRKRHQSILCIDDRFESLRRHIEEAGPDRETFGAAGFFGVVMYYRGVDDWHASPLCPVALRPEHTVFEEPLTDHVGLVRAQRRLRRFVALPVAALSAGSRSLVGGLLSVTAGAIAAIPLVARVLFPGSTGRLSRSAGSLLTKSPATRLAIEHSSEARLPDNTQAGYNVSEMTAIVWRLLEDIGLVSGFARLVAVIGHGSSSRNNPHESGYNCGACGGGRGGPNGRVWAAMANDGRVRKALADQGLLIPSETWFLGAAIDTCSNTIEWFDTDRVPEIHAGDVRQLTADYDAALAADALERCRRFETAGGLHAARDALRHVQARANDLAEVRPELGHAANAACIIGRRSRSRGLFLDRRAFLASYDPTTDASAEVLARTLAAVVPVCAGINLEYWFSTVDGDRYGCGTKLPHNITGLLGVMDGHASDLRTGLPRQMVELHEPLRLMVVVDGEPEAVRAALEAVPAVKQLVDNEWIQLAAWDDRGDVWHFRGGHFQRHDPGAHRLPKVDQSIDWFAGRTGQLAPAVVLAGQPDEAGELSW